MVFKSNILGKIILGLAIFLTLFLGGLSYFWQRAKANLKSQDGRVNILVMGKAGGDHAGPDLTDTMMLVSVSLTKPTVTLISIPRDIWIPEIRAKINSAYYWGGTPMAKSLVEKILGQPVQYTLVLDFSGFKEIIDAVGGIEVNVDRSFTDTKYPIAGKENDLCDGDKELKCRYETVHFDQGLVKMDGETALKFVRSRHGDNGENTDLAREARQQKVIAAIKNKVLSFGSLINLGRDLKIYRALKDSVTADINKKTGLVLLYRLFLARNNIKFYVFPVELLVNPPISSKYDNQYVFVPKADDWSEVGAWVKKLLNQ